MPPINNPLSSNSQSNLRQLFGGSTQKGSAIGARGVLKDSQSAANVNNSTKISESNQPRPFILGAGPRGSMKSADTGIDLRNFSTAYGGPSVFNRNSK